jgi:DNA polymerase III delta prime subunit
MQAKSMSMLREGSVVITGGTLSLRQNCLGQILKASSAFAEIEKFLQKQSFSNEKKETPIPENDPDVIFLLHEKEKIGVGDVRSFLGLLNIKPIGRKEKVGIILEAEKLTPEAQNALLKTLEEPPASCLIFLTVPHPKTLLPTILSRCLIIDLGKKGVDEKKVSSRGLTALSVGDKFALAQKVGSTRQQALDFLDSLFLELHQSLLSAPQMANSHFEKIKQAKKIISANGNVRLTLENLFLDW